ncbi:MAG: ComEC/Rec2 family competence protein [Bacteroidales bacterium]
MLRLLIPVITGITVQYYFNIPLYFVVPACVILFFLLLLVLIIDAPGYFNIRWLYGLIISCFLFAFSIYLSGKNLQRPSLDDYTSKEGLLFARVIELPQEREKSYRTLIEPYAFFSFDGTEKISGRIIGWFEKDSCAGMLKVGDLIVIPNNLRKISNPGNPFEFDFIKYWRMRGISYEAYVPINQWFIGGTKGGIPESLLIMSGRLRKYLLGVLKNNGIEGKEYAVAGALLLGYREALDRELKQSYSESGAMHILAVSGLHVGILYIFLHWVFGFMNKTRYSYFIKLFIILVIIWFYALLTGLSPSVTRAATMFSFLSVSRSLNMSSNIFNTLAAAAFVQLIAEPFALFLVGFQLSYLAVTGIAFYQPVFYSVFKFKNMVFDKIWTLITVSLAAQMFIFPLIVFYFNQFPNYFLLTNIFAVPLAMTILYAGIMLFATSFIPSLAAVFAFILKCLLSFLNFIIDTINHLPYSHTPDIVIGKPLLLVIYGIIISGSLFFIIKKSWLLNCAIILTITGLIIRADHKIKTSGQNIFVVYNTSGLSLYNFISGKDNLIITGNGNGQFSGSLPYEAERAAVYLNTGNEARVISAGDIFSPRQGKVNHPMFSFGSFAVFNGHHIYFSCSDELRYIQPGKMVYVDLLVISSGSSADIMELSNFIIPGIVIIDSSVPFNSRQKFIRQCREAGLDYHDVNTSGAFYYAIRD